MHGADTSRLAMVWLPRIGEQRTWRNCLDMVWQVMVSVWLSSSGPAQDEHKQSCQAALPSTAQHLGKGVLALTAAWAEVFNPDM